MLETVQTVSSISVLEPHTNPRRVASTDRAIFLRVLNNIRVVKLVRVGEVDCLGRENDVRRHVELNAGIELVIVISELRHAGLCLRRDQILVSPRVRQSRLQWALLVKPDYRIR